MDLKEQYSINHSNLCDRSIELNHRLYETYNFIVKKKLGKSLSGINIDLGSGDKGFSKYCESIGIQSFPHDYPTFNIEKDLLDFKDETVDFVTMNAVIEHISNCSHIFSEINRVLKPNGLLFVRTPNWKMDYKNFFNDPTHIKPYTPETLESVFNLSGFKCVFLEPGLIQKKWFWWTLPNNLKWNIASWIPGGTKSIIGVAEKKRTNKK